MGKGTENSNDGDESSSSIEDRRRRRRRKRSKSSRRDDDDRKRRSKRASSRQDDSSSSSSEEDQRRKHRKHRKRKYSRKERKEKKRKTRRSDSSSDESSQSSDDTDGLSHDGRDTQVVVNERLLAKLAARGETLEERKARRAEKRAADIKAKLGYTADDNPFNDPNLTETFTWKKRDDKKGLVGKTAGVTSMKTLEEIEKVRKRRKDREEHFEEMERIRAEESRMKELENYDDWARKEEEFHLQQQRHRSAIRLVEGREQPIDVLAKNILMFGLSDAEKKDRNAVKYQERYNAMDAVESLEAELEEPSALVKVLKLNELEELIVDIDAFRRLEREASSGIAGIDTLENNNPVLQYWDNLHVLVTDEIKYLKSGGEKGHHAQMTSDVDKIFEGQSLIEMMQMRSDVHTKLRTDSSGQGGEEFDRTYWLLVQERLSVALAKAELSDLHSKMLVRQLERLETKKEELAQVPGMDGDAVDAIASGEIMRHPNMPENVSAMDSLGDLEEELGLDNGEIALPTQNYTWQDRYRPRKPRYFNRVKTGYDWNKYNQTHYDKDNPPPKIVQGYKFNIFYPDLIDPTKTPQFFLEAADVDEFCIIRFRAGPPYEDLAFKIVNREWNRSRKRGFKSTFERGVLSLYFNFTTHWYRK